MLKNANENGEVNIILILLLIIIIASIVLGLKITGIIKPKHSEISSNTTVEQFNNINSSYDKNDKNIFETLEKKYKKQRTISIVISIISLIVAIGLNIGICLLYKKLNIPSYLVKLNFVWPILSIISSFLPGFLQTILSIASFIIGLMGLWYYFKAVDMSGWWAILPMISIFLMIIPLVGFAGFIIFIIAYIISNIHLAKMFDKDLLFTVGLAILPFIFQPILGFQRD